MGVKSSLFSSVSKTFFIFSTLLRSKIDGMGRLMADMGISYTYSKNKLKCQWIALSLGHQGYSLLVPSCHELKSCQRIPCLPFCVKDVLIAWKEKRHIQSTGLLYHTCQVGIPNDHDVMQGLSARCIANHLQLWMNIQYTIGFHIICQRAGDWVP